MKNYTRNSYRILIFSTFILINVFVIFGISKVLSYFNRGADRSTMLKVAKDTKNFYIPKFSWINTKNPGRVMEKQTLVDLKRDYLHAWYLRYMSFETNTTIGIDDYYTQNARKNLQKIVAENKRQNIRTNGTTLQHAIDIHFYSEDGQLIAFTDRNVKEYQQVFKNDKMLFENIGYYSYKVVMLKEDGYWRIRHMVKTKSTALNTNSTNPLNQKLYPANFRYKGINYYPQNSPWNMFGERFDKNVLSRDFTLIAEQGLNSIRIFIPYHDFGKSDIPSSKIEQLKTLLQIAEDNGLKVMVTLFDSYGDYKVIDWSITQRHLEQIVTPFITNPTILAWDIKNEPDLDFKSRKKENVLAWLKVTVDYLKEIDPNHQITIGWSSSKAAHLLHKELDFISYHYYGKPKDFAKGYTFLKEIIPYKKIVLQEFGASSDFGFWNPFGKNRTKQEYFYRDFQKILSENSIDYLSWTLYDFTSIPDLVVGVLPWRKNKQKNFGFIDTDGNEKPAFEYISK